jgi:hypothetical protein
MPEEILQGSRKKAATAQAQGSCGRIGIAQEFVFYRNGGFHVLTMIILRFILWVVPGPIANPIANPPPST